MTFKITDNKDGTKSLTCDHLSILQTIRPPNFKCRHHCIDCQVRSEPPSGYYTCSKCNGFGAISFPRDEKIEGQDVFVNFICPICDESGLIKWTDVTKMGFAHEYNPES